MGHAFETGLMVRKPSWHRREKAVLLESPKTWQDARDQSGLTWEVQSEPVYDSDETGMSVPIPGWQKVVRDDKTELGARVLGIQPETYAMITMAEYGEVIDTALGITSDDEKVVFESLMSLYGGKLIVALTYFENPLRMPWDPSVNYSFVCFASRHDGNGGLRGIPTNVRVVCANTFNRAEQTDGRKVGFTIRHTANFKDRLEEVGKVMAMSREDSGAWVDFTEKLALWNVTDRRRDAFLKKLIPISDDMGLRAMNNAERSRDRVRLALSSESCAGIEKTGYGLLMATSEWSDHLRDHRTTDSYISRQLLGREDNKAKAVKILSAMAGI